MYSFVEPNVKPVVSYLAKIWLFFVMITLFILFGFNMILNYKISSFEKTIKGYTQKEKKFIEEITVYKKKIEMIESEKKLFEEISTSNELLKNSLKSFFALIPDQITLSKVILDENSLVIFGVTPSKDIYDFFLAPPLKSVFSKSVVDFYLQKNGWYRFVSKNENNSDSNRKDKK